METENTSNSAGPRWPSIWLCAAFLAFFVSLWQLRCCGYMQLDLEWSYRRSNDVIQGASISPWQYRILSHLEFRALTRLAGVLGFENPQHEALCIYRLLQNLAVFFLSAWYYRKLGLGDRLITLGLSILAGGMLHTLYAADMSLDTYTDVVFYVVAALLILHNKPCWFLLLAPLAALNRETAGLIPIMLLAWSYVGETERRVRINRSLVAMVALALYAVAILAIRACYGPRIGMAGHSAFSSTLMVRNFAEEQSWLQLFVTMGLVPVLAFCSLPTCPKVLRIFFWSLVPVWFGIHFFSAAVAETRLFLVPMVVVLVPCMLFGVASTTGEAGSDSGGTRR